MTTRPDWLPDDDEASGSPESIAITRPTRPAPPLHDPELEALCRTETGVTPVPGEIRILSPERLQELDKQYRVSYTPGEVQVTELLFLAGHQVQAMRPPWPQHLMLDVYKGYASISLQFMLPELPGEDLGMCVSDCREDILDVLPAAWRNAVELGADRQVSWEHLDITCSIKIDPQPGEEERTAILCEVAVRSADLNLLGTLTRALAGQREAQARLPVADVDDIDAAQNI